jgi:hypothetical protein
MQLYTPQPTSLPPKLRSICTFPHYIDKNSFLKNKPFDQNAPLHTAAYVGRRYKRGSGVVVIISVVVSVVIIVVIVIVIVIVIVVDAVVYFVTAVDASLCR